MRTSRLVQLERLARSRLCLGCGQTFAPHAAGAKAPDWQRLNAAEQKELAGILSVATTPECVRCGRSCYDLSKLSHADLDRLLKLLRTLL